jgi:hypothetical protein
MQFAAGANGLATVQFSQYGTPPTGGVQYAFDNPVLMTGVGAASLPGLQLTGAPYTGGSATTNFPQLYLNAGVAPTTWSTAGTELGVNLPSGFTGNVLDFHNNGGSSFFSLNYQGNVTGGTYNGTTIPTSQTLAYLAGSQTFTGTPVFSNAFNVSATASSDVIAGGQSRSGAFQGIFNFQLANATAAISSQNYISPLYSLQGTYWTGSASAAMNNSQQLIFGSGTEPLATYTFAMGGTQTTGGTLYSFDSPIKQVTAYSAAGTAIPTCNSTYQNAEAIVSDATSPTFLGTYTSGGAVRSPVMCNGTNWVTY